MPYRTCRATAGVTAAAAAAAAVLKPVYLCGQAIGMVIAGTSTYKVRDNSWNISFSLRLTAYRDANVEHGLLKCNIHGI